MCKLLCSARAPFKSPVVEETGYLPHNLSAFPVVLNQVPGISLQGQWLFH